MSGEAGPGAAHPPEQRAHGVTVAADFEPAWADFRTRTHTLGPTPGVREAWHRGRAAYTVWLLPVSDPVVVAEVAELQAALGPLVRPVPLDELHITVWVSGFVASSLEHDDDVLLDALLAQQAALDAAPPAAPRLSLGPVGSFWSAAILEVRDPFGELEALRQCLWAGPPEIRFAPYRPHLTLGSYTADHPVSDVLSVLEPARARATVRPLRPTELRRVELDPTRAEAPHRVVYGVGLPSEPPGARP